MPNEIYTDLEFAPKINMLTYKGKQYELIEIDLPAFVLAQAKPYEGFEMVRNLHNIDGKSINQYQYKAIQIDGKNYGFKLIEHE